MPHLALLTGHALSHTVACAQMELTRLFSIKSALYLNCIKQGCSVVLFRYEYESVCYYTIISHFG